MEKDPNITNPGFNGHILPVPLALYYVRVTLFMSFLNFASKTSEADIFL